MNETSVTVVGNVASDVTAKQVGTEGHVVVSFRVASSERRWDRTSGSWVDGDRFSARVSCWRRLGDHVLVSLRKGDPVVVRGRVSVREYEVNGERRYSTELTASAVGPDLGRCAALLTRTRGAVDPARTPGVDGASREEVSEVGVTAPAEAAGAERAPAVPDAAAGLLADDAAVELVDGPDGDRGPDTAHGLPAVA
jgi:single-strand DNA-binding protein